MAKINMKGLRAEIAQKGYKVFKDKVTPRIEKAFKKETAKLLAAFDDHEITKEIQSGPGASNTSGTLGGYGNLFSFIGFKEGQDPLSPIRSLLARSIKITTIRKKRGELGLILKFSVPSEQEIAEVTPSPWSTESWVEAVEKGMSGLGRYLYSSQQGRFSSSRSGTGVELEVEVRSSANSQPTKYMSKILGDMLKNIESSLKRL